MAAQTAALTADKATVDDVRFEGFGLRAEIDVLRRRLEIAEQAEPALRAEIAELKAAKGLQYRGIYETEQTYPEGSVVSFQGGMWAAIRSRSNRTKSPVCAV